MSRPKTPPNPKPAARVADLLAASDPASVELREEHARKHFERTRNKPARPSARVAALVEKGTRGEKSPSPSARAVRTADAKPHEHEGPTRSLVLNAFVHQLGSERLISIDAVVLHEEDLAPKLFELSRRYMARLLMLIGHADTALAVAPMLRPVVNAEGARLHIRQAAKEPGALGAIARDYVAYRERHGNPAKDDRHASCVMAAFAGKLLTYAEARLGEHVRDEVRESLEALLESERVAAARKRRPPPRARPDENLPEPVPSRQQSSSSKGRPR
ncbi:hypothetical protein [Chondromyces crocatus]|uniref:Uncharacterized protein n=1 Tax=Chondromyces crocatus TaxID=52 RepID=A0A0K1E5L3_CHOCO|nr:hypothetical protein [Chondromyces crocatus]AKT35982.1 uncharacterized protein CMC5_000940 [Chondromyces crocatus]